MKFKTGQTVRIIGNALQQWKGFEATVIDSDLCELATPTDIFLRPNEDRPDGNHRILFYWPEEDLELVNGSASSSVARHRNQSTRIAGRSR